MKQRLKYKTRKDREISFCNKFNEFQRTWLEVCNVNKQLNIVVGVYYKHPTKDSNDLFDIKLKNYSTKDSG